MAYHVALVQNQTEMAHYGYADARPLLEERGYTVHHFTGSNILDLTASLGSQTLNAVVVGSNALSDPDIRREMRTGSAIEGLSAMLRNGGGILVFQQLKLAGIEDNYLLLSDDEDLRVSATPRPLSESAIEGDLRVPPDSSLHPLLIYPHQVDPSAVAEHSRRFRSLPGLYWHSWVDFNADKWQVLLDDFRQGETRPILLATREDSVNRIVLSSMANDWQDSANLLDNALIYAVEGRHELAVLATTGGSMFTFDYLRASFHARQFPVHYYDVGTDQSALARNLRLGVHSTLLIGAAVGQDRLASALKRDISSRIEAGLLKVVGADSTSWVPEPSFSIATRQAPALNLLSAVELQVLTDLRLGYVDGMFWATVETLQHLLELTSEPNDYLVSATRALDLASEHDRSGSYDEVFGASCALLWFRSKCGSADLRPTLDWIRARVSAYAMREQMLAIRTLILIGEGTSDECRAAADQIRLIELDSLSEIDLVNYLETSLLLDELELSSRIARALVSSQSSGMWLDLATTAEGTLALLKLLRRFSEGTTAAPKLVSLSEEIRGAVFRSIAIIQDEFHASTRPGNSAPYPWDGKASTSAKCLHAWLVFDELLKSPVYEIANAITTESATAAGTRFTSAALASLRELEVRNAELEETLQGKRAESQAGLAWNIRRVWYRAVTLLLVYALCVLCVATAVAKRTGMGEVLRVGVIEAWQLHGLVAGLMLAGLAVQWGTFRSNPER